MNDHNLDDLIIDDIEPKNSKTKSFLTIIALLIVVLIVAIILTKIILKDPNSARLALEENNTELISPELTLQSVTQTPEKKEEPKAPVVIPKPQVVKPSVVKKVEKITPPTVQITKEFSQETSANAQKEKEAKLAQKEKEAKLAQKRKEAEAKKKAEEAAVKKALEKERITKEKVLKAERTEKEVLAKKELQNTKPANSGYYIQVGSFAQTPSTRFLSIIKNSGFDYKITPVSSTGTKKLLIGPYTNRKEANIALVRVKDRINKGAFVVKK